MKQILLHARLFDGNQFHAGKAVTLEDGQIGSIIERSIAPGGFERHDLTGLVLAPGFIDLQAYGGGGHMVDDATDLPKLEAIADAHRAHGTTSLLPTLMSDTCEAMTNVAECIIQAHHHWGENSSLAAIKGVHFDGPYINGSISNARTADLARAVDENALDLVSHPDLGIRLVTLAPEKVGPAFIERLTDAGVLVAAGTSLATYQQVAQAARAGLRGVSKLFSAMAAIEATEPGLAGAALGHNDLWCGLVADGFHVHPALMRAAIQAKPKGKVFFTSAAMASVGWDGQSFVHHGRKIERKNGVCVFEDGKLAGSDLSMMGAVRNGVELLDLPLSEALRMASLYPAEFIRMDMTHGFITPGYAADLVAFDPENWQVKHSWINGYHRAH